MRRLFFFLLLLFPFFLPAQDEKHPKADSLQRLIDEESSDTVKLRLQNKLFNEFLLFDPDRAMLVAQEELALAQSARDSSWIIAAYDNMAHVYWINGDQPNAITYLQKGMEICEKRGDKREIANSYNNIGVVYRGTKNLDQALVYFQKAYVIREELHDTAGLGTVYCNIGLIYDNKGELRKGLSFYQKSLAIRLKMHDTPDLAIVYTNMGAAYIRMNLIDSARMAFDTALVLYRRLRDLQGIATCYQNLGSVYHAQKDYDKSILYQDSAIYLGRKSGKLEVVINAYGELSKVEEERGNFATALAWFQKKTALSDSMFNVNVSGQVAEMEAKYHNEKERRENDKLKNDITHQEALRTYSILIAGMALLIAVALLYAYRNKRKSNLQLTAQKAHIETQKQEITDSIAYAQRIQQAILPQPGLLNSIFPESFVLYMPKAIVSGDFWWLQAKNNETWIAVGDCTGHGVPGAFMSMLGVDKLNALVQENNSPAELLAMLNRSVKQTLHQSNEITSEDLRDGMDIALAVFSKDKKQIRFSGANRLLWIFKANGESQEYKSTKAAIGGHTIETQTFAQNEIQLSAGDTAYLFSDGFADQFGGPENKKIMTKRMRQWIAAIQHLPMKKQQEELQKQFSEWRGTNEQVDDVLIVGIRV